MEEVSKDVVKSASVVAGKFYDDALHPSLKPIGEILSFLPRTIKLKLSSWEKWLINGEESLRLTAESIKEKVKNIPEDKIVEPEPYVAIPAMQQICYCQDSAALRDLYANLLVASMNKDTKWNVHPSYVDIIKQLCPDEAKYLSISLYATQAIPYPLIDVVFKNTGYIILSNFTTTYTENLEHPENICTYIDNLVRLNLINIPAGLCTSDIFYTDIKKSSLLKELVRKADYVPDLNFDTDCNCRHKCFRLTNLGLGFIETVCDGGKKVERVG